MYCRYKCIINMIAHQHHTVNMEKKGMGENMTRAQKRTIIFIVVIAAAAVLGRLAVRAVINLMVGGTLFGGNFL